MKTSLVDDTRTDSPVSSWFEGARHIEDIAGADDIVEDRELWRRTYKERLKTVSYAVVMCLNLGIEPPDMMRRQVPCGKLECWVDPQGMSPQKAVQQIVKNIQATYERWQPRARFKIATDPTVDEVRRLCQGMRRNAKDERVLFHYNGHGVPKPTENGELWVFNTSFTQYIPLSIYDLQTWIANPSVYVWDCNAAGLIVKSFSRFAGDQEKEWVKQLDEHMETRSPPLPEIQAWMSIDERASAFGFPRKPNYRDCIHLAACAEDEYLPIDPDLPADLFTSCLTTPIKTSILWHILKNGLKDSFPLSNLDRIIPGEVSDRRSILGELNWIFTAITDTIAWDALSKELFQKIFRLDLVLASLCRSFLLADRVMLAYNRHVVSEPRLPSLHDHPLWDAWDFTLDHCLDRIRGVALQNSNVIWNLGKELHFVRTSLRYNILIELNNDWYKSEKENAMPLNWFFKDQLKAFDMWLRYGADKHVPPQQLPVVLQVLLSQQYRVEALKLLARFLDLGAWAVGHALTVGIFPYMLKLLQSGLKDLRQWLAFIWAKILAVEPTCQADLVKDKEQGYLYFITILNDISVSPWHKIASAFVTAAIIHNDYSPAQDVLSTNGYISICVELLSGSAIENCRLLKLWVLIGLGRLWSGHDKARWQAIRLVAHDRVMDCLDNVVPEIRAAAMYALGCLVRNRSESDEHASSVDHEICERIATKCMYEGSVLVRAELVVALQWFIIDFEQHFANTYLELNKKIAKRKIFSKELIEDKVVLERNESRRPVRRSNYGRKFSVGENENNRIPENEPSLQYSTLPRDYIQQSFRRQPQPVPQRSNSMVLGPLYEFTEDNGNLASLPISKRARKEENIFKEKVWEQMQILEAQLMMSQVERVWFAVLWLSLDPVKKVSEMARVLIDYVEKVAVAKKKRFSNIYKHSTTSLVPSAEKVIEKLRSPERPTFTIGSPTTGTFDRTGSYLAEMHTRNAFSPGDHQLLSGKSNERGDLVNEEAPTGVISSGLKLTGERSNNENIASVSAPVHRTAAVTGDGNEDFPDTPLKRKTAAAVEGVVEIHADGNALSSEGENGNPRKDFVVEDALGCKKGDVTDSRAVADDKCDTSKRNCCSLAAARPTFHIVSSDECSTSPHLQDCTSEKSRKAAECNANTRGNSLQRTNVKAAHSDTATQGLETYGAKATTATNSVKSSPKSIKLEKASNLQPATSARHETSRRKRFSDLAKHTIEVLVEQSGGKRVLNGSGSNSVGRKGSTDVNFSRAVSVSENAQLQRNDGRSGVSNFAKSVPQVAIEVPVDVTDATNTTSEVLTIAAEAIDVVEKLTAENGQEQSGFGDINDVPAPEVTHKQTRKISQGPLTGGSSSSRQKAKVSRLESPTVPLFQSLSIFTPKRKVHAPSMNSMVRMDEVEVKDKEPLAPLITTEFIPWCSKRVTEPLLDVIERRVGDGLNDKLCNRRLPSDWAYYKREVLLKSAEQEHQILENSSTAQCDSQLFFLKPEKPVTSIAWSYLRPHIYTCDGRNFDIWRYEVQKTPEIKRRIDCTDNNPYCSDIVCQVEAINDMTRELIIMGSTDSLMRIWDPGYSIFSNEFEKEQRLVTAAYLLKDESRLGDGLKTVYRWSQQKGCIIASGNVGICRFWDAVTERKLQDLRIIPRVMSKAKKPYVTKICSDTCNPELLCLGMSDGTVYYYDLRIPSGEKQRVMSLLGLRGSVVGLSTFSTADASGDDNMSIVAGSDSGEVRIWDPRMYEEPLTEFNICTHSKTQDLKMLSMDVQNHGKLIACATTMPEVLVYDKDRVKLRGTIKYDDALIGGRLGAPSAVRFHPLRVMLAVSTEERMVSAYGIPHSLL